MRFAMYLLFLFILSGSVPLSSQSLFHRTFPSAPETGNRNYIDEKLDGGYVVIFESEQVGLTGNMGFRVLCYDACDQLEWSKAIHSDDERLWITGLYVTKENDVLVAGSAELGAEAAIFLAKLNSKGELQFLKKYKEYKSGAVSSIGQLTTGEYFLQCVYFESKYVMRNGIIKLDQSGNVIWSKLFAELPQWSSRYAIGTSDGNILSQVSDHISKIDPNGNVLWSKVYSDKALYFESKPIEVADGYVYARYNGAVLVDTLNYLLKIDFQGNEIWTSDKFVGTAIYNIVELSNGHFVAASDVYVDTTNGYKTFVTLTELDEMGQLIRQEMMSSAGDFSYRFYSMVKLMNGDIVLSGVEEHALLPISQLYINRTNEELELGGCSKSLKIVDAGKISLNLNDNNYAVENLPVSSEDIVNMVSPFTPIDIITCGSAGSELGLNLGPDTILCAGESLELSLKHQYVDHEWSTGSKERNLRISKTGTYSLWVFTGCDTLYDTINVEVRDRLELKYNVSPLQVDNHTPVMFNSENDDATSIHWDYNEGESNLSEFKYIFDRDGRHRIIYTISNDYGCLNADTLYVDVNYFCSVEIPNSFTPNNDGLNDVFEPVGLGIENFRLEIYDRWGKLVFEGENTGWTGTIESGRAALGTYVYRITYMNQCERSQFERGLLHLIR